VSFTAIDRSGASIKFIQEIASGLKIVRYIQGDLLAQGVDSRMICWLPWRKSRPAPHQSKGSSWIGPQACSIWTACSWVTHQAA